MIHFESSYESVKREAIEGAKVLASSVRGTEANSAPKFSVGNKVRSTEACTYKFVNGLIVDRYEENGYYYYVVSLVSGDKIFRQKDLEFNYIIERGYMVVFNVLSSGYEYTTSLEKAMKLRNCVAGGGIIYHATLEKHGLNTSIVRGAMVRNSYGTPV